MYEVSCDHISASLTRLSSASLIDNVSDLLLTNGMKTIEEIRHARLNMLVAEYGSISALADVLKMSHSQVSQWVNKSIDHKSKKPRTMSSPIARRIEVLTNKPAGWMDQHIYSEDFDRIFSMLKGIEDKNQLLKIESVIRALVGEDQSSNKTDRRDPASKGEPPEGKERRKKNEGWNPDGIRFWKTH